MRKKPWRSCSAFIGSAWCGSSLQLNAKRLIAAILILSISILLSGCATKHPPKPLVTEDYIEGHGDGYNAAIDHSHDLINRMIDFTNYSYHTNLTLTKVERKKIYNKTVEYQRGFANGWKVSNGPQYGTRSIIYSDPVIIIEHDGTRDGIIVPTANHRTKIRKYKRKPQ